jgi:hypothetical protein
MNFLQKRILLIQIHTKKSSEIFIFMALAQILPKRERKNNKTGAGYKS